MRFVLLLALISIAPSVFAQFGPASPFQQRVAEIMRDSEIRTDSERARDQNRQAGRILEFFRLEDDMSVIEILPFTGWYSKILAPLLEQDGQLYVTHPSPTFYSEAFIEIAAMEGMDAVEEVDWNGSPAESNGNPFFASGPWDVEPVDMVLTFRNYHNFSLEVRQAVNESSFDALKPGGLYGIVDHTRRHMEPTNGENGRRVDPVMLIKEVQDAGFVLVDYTNILRRPDDELEYEVARRSVAGNTDRFALLFEKPE